MPKLKHFFVTTPIYYVNDQPHLGHLYTALAADVLARYWRQKKYEVFFLTGTDEHGAKVAKSAEEAGESAKEFCDRVSRLFKETFKSFNLSFDYFIRTTDERHKEAVKKFLLELKAKKLLYQDEYEGLYCVGCEKFITEKELVDGQCPDHKVAPTKIKEKNWFFKLQPFLPKVKKLILSGKLKIEPEARRNETLSLLDQGLEDFSISREKVNWGIDLPWESSQKVYVWVEALQNYISAIGFGDNQKEFKKWWPADLHLMAKDILKFHAIYWPAMLLAAELPLPKKLFIHGFFTINGQKMSKSLGNVIAPEGLAKRFGVEASRYLILTQFPFGQDGDIKDDQLAIKYQADLANGLGNLVARTLKMIEEYCQGCIPKVVKTPQDLKEVAGLIEKLKFDEALKKIWEAITWGNRYIDQTKPWELNRDPKKKAELAKILSQLAALICEVARALETFMPATSEEISKRLTAKKIVKGEALFPRV